MMKSHILLASTFVLAAGCTAVDAKQCQLDSECGATEVCQGATTATLGTCEARPTPVATACHEDFDCAVGEVCLATVCTAAASATAPRTFGIASMSFTAGTEQYLVAVYAPPLGAAAGNEPAIDFTFAAPSAASGALTIARVRNASVTSTDLVPGAAFDAARRARIDGLVEDLNAGRISLAGAVTKSASCGDCGTKMCWGGACVDTNIALKFASANKTVTCDLAAVVTSGGVKVNVLLDQANAAAKTVVVDAATKFAASFAKEVALLGQTGHTGVLDRDGDGRITVAFTDTTTADIGLDKIGFFDVNDFLPAGISGATGNETDILWSRVPAPSGVDLAIGTLVHEYTHLAGYALRVQARNNAALRESGWLDEALASIMEDQTGWGGSNIAYASAALGQWNSCTYAGNAQSQIDSPAQRGKAFLLLRNIIDQDARTAGATSTTSAQVATAATTLISGLLIEAKLGWEHAIFQNRSRDVLGQMLVAAYTTHNPAVTAAGAGAYDFLTLATPSGSSYPIGVDPYHTYKDAKGVDVSLGGPDFIDIDPTSSKLSENTIESSGTLTYLVSGGAGQVTLRGQALAARDVRLTVKRVQ